MENTDLSNILKRFSLDLKDIRDTVHTIESNMREMCQNEKMLQDRKSWVKDNLASIEKVINARIEEVKILQIYLCGNRRD